jgi:hypothetical protein
MRVHDAIVVMRPDLAPLIIDQATRLGLDSINYEQRYTLEKVKAKRKSAYLPNDGITITGEVLLVGSKEHVAIFIQSNERWFRTSPICEVVRLDNEILLETVNSVYLLTEADLPNHPPKMNV